MTVAASRFIARLLRKRSGLGSQPGKSSLPAAVEVLGGRQIVEQREVLIDGLDAGQARRGRRMQRRPLAVEQDLAFVERVDAADALDQGRLAGAVVAEKGKHLAAIGVEADALESMDRPEAFLRMADGQRGLGGHAHCILPACSTRTRASRWLRRTSASTATTMIEADGDHLEEDVDAEQVERVADDADQHRADERMAEMPAAAKEARATDDHRGDGVEFEKVAVEGRGSSGAPRKHDRPDAGAETRDDVGGEKHVPDRECPCSWRRFGRAADGIDPASRHHGRPDEEQQRHAEDDKKELGRPKVQLLPRARRHPACRAWWCGPVPVRGPAPGRCSASRA
jgi:hypothetical protein